VRAHEPSVGANLLLANCLESNFHWAWGVVESATKVARVAITKATMTSSAKAPAMNRLSMLILKAKGIVVVDERLIIHRSREPKKERSDIRVGSVKYFAQ
jgi:hypothetical protein